MFFCIQNGLKNLALLAVLIRLIDIITFMDHPAYHRVAV